jgi:hypothetical protein
MTEPQLPHQLSGMELSRHRKTIEADLRSARFAATRGLQTKRGRKATSKLRGRSLPFPSTSIQPKQD